MPTESMRPGSPSQAPSPSRLSVSAGQQAASSGIQADQLFHGRQEIQIDHNGEIYRLRITRNGKLILTK
jgi:hemin uptake protein HemP